MTAADWGEVAARDPQIQRAAGRFRWTGSWHTAFVAVHCKGGRTLARESAEKAEATLERYRMAGEDLVVASGETVGLELALDVCVAPGHFCSDVAAGLLQRLSNRRLADGSLGAFHPDRFSFGDPVYLSHVHAAAVDVPGVSAVTVAVFRRVGTQDTDGLSSGRLDFGPFEIPRLDNDPDFPENGTLRIDTRGGK